MKHRYPPGRNSSSIFFKLLLTLICALQLSIANASNIPPQKPNLPDGVSARDPGAELWREVRRREGASEFNEVNQGILVNELLQEIQKSRQMPPGTSQVDQVDSGVLINAKGRRWANFRMTTLADYSGIALAAIFVIIITFYVVRGKVPIEGGLSGNMVKRFTDYERIQIVVLEKVTTAVIRPISRYFFECR